MSLKAGTVIDASLLDPAPTKARNLLIPLRRNG